MRSSSASSCDATGGGRRCARGRGRTGVSSTRTRSPGRMRMRKRRILPATWPRTSWSLSSFTRNMAFGSASMTSPSNSTLSSLAIARDRTRAACRRRLFVNGDSRWRLLGRRAPCRRRCRRRRRRWLRRRVGVGRRRRGPASASGSAGLRLRRALVLVVGVRGRRRRCRCRPCPSPGPGRRSGPSGSCSGRPCCP